MVSHIIEKHDIKKKQTHKGIEKGIDQMFTWNYNKSSVD